MKVSSPSRMTVDINTYRVRVGKFDQRPNRPKDQKSRSGPNKVKLPEHVIHTYFLLSCLMNMYFTNRFSCYTQNTCTFIFNARQIKIVLGCIIFFLTALLILAGDIELNPGPNIIAPTDNLACYFLNARSIKQITDRSHKLREFKELLTIANPSILGDSENWLNKKIDEEDIATVNEYTIYRKDRSQKKGAVSCYWSNHT